MLDSKHIFHVLLLVYSILCFVFMLVFSFCFSILSFFFYLLQAVNRVPQTSWKYKNDYSQVLSSNPMQVDKQFQKL